MTLDISLLQRLDSEETTVGLVRCNGDTCHGRSCLVTCVTSTCAFTCLSTCGNGITQRPV